MKLVRFIQAGKNSEILINPEFVVYVRSLTQSTSAMSPVTRIVVLAQELNPRSDVEPITPGFIDVIGTVPAVTRSLLEAELESGVFHPHDPEPFTH